MLLELATAIALLADPSVPRVDPNAHVRPMSDEARYVLDEAMRRSATVAQLVAELQRHDVIVYFELSLLKESARGSTTLFAATPISRMLRVIISWKLGPRERIEVLGHELHHALEIAKAAEVVDTKTFRTFFRRVGYELGQGGYETAAARQIEEEVRRDLSRAAPLRNLKDDLPDQVQALAPPSRV